LPLLLLLLLLLALLQAKLQARCKQAVCSTELRFAMHVGI
jgi:hypothetical protein